MEIEPTVFYLVRHGEAENNVLHILNSYSEADRYALTEKGRGQATKVATNDLSEDTVDIIFSSPIRRTRETAEIIARATGAKVIFDERLRETDFGIYSGRPTSALWGKYPDPLMRLDGNEEEHLEGFGAMRDRLESFLKDVLAKYAGKTIVIVSHGDPLEQVHGILLGDSVQKSVNGWYPEKGSCTKVISKLHDMSRS